VPATQLTQELAEEMYLTYKPIPAAFVADIFACQPWAIQSEIIDAVFKYKVVAVKSCNAAGKSWLAAHVALAFLELHPGSIVVTTAPTWRQVKDVLWREMGAAYELAIVKLSKAEISQTGLEFAKDWFAVGLSTKDSEKFFGYHADDILVIVDEASGVEEAIYIGVDAITPNINAHVLMIGNPTNPDGRFYKAFNNPLVKQFTISVFDTPNFTANNIKTVDELVTLFEPPEGVDPIEHMNEVESRIVQPSHYKGLISLGAVYRRYLEWGTDSPFWEALIMGQFPSQSEFSLIPINLIQQSMEVTRNRAAGRRSEDEASYKVSGWNIEDGGLEIGIDVARYGMDRTVIMSRRGGWVDPALAWSKQDTQVTADRIIMAIDPTDPHTFLKVDDTGVGGGVTDALLRRKADRTGNQSQWLYKVSGINFGDAPAENAPTPMGQQAPPRFTNRRAEMFWNLRELFMAKKIAIPDDPELAGELGAIRFNITDKGLIQIEKKDDIKKRTGKSPDKADALALAFASGGAGTFEMSESSDRPAGFVPEPGIEYEDAPISSGLSGKVF
jgi:phage terminase large subunit